MYHGRAFDWKNSVPRFTFHFQLFINSKFLGDDHIDQLKRIMDLSGTPGPELLAKIQSVHAQNYIKTLEKRRPKDFSEVFRPCSPLVR